MRSNWIERIREKPFFLKLLLGLIASAIIPTLISVTLLYSQYSHKMIDEFRKYNDKLLEQVIMNSDDMLIDMMYAVRLLLSDPALMEFMEHHYESNPKKFNDWVDNIKNMSSSTSMVSKIVVNFDKMDYNLEINEDLTSEISKKPSADEEGVSIQTKEVSGNWMASNVSYVEHNNQFAFRMTYPVVDKAFNKLGTIIVETNQAKYNKVLNLLDDPDGTLLILNERAQQILCKGQLCGQRDLLIASIEQSNTRMIEIEGEPYTLLNRSSDYSGWKFIYSLPRKNIVAKVNVYYQLTLIFILITLTAGISFALLYGNYLYSPVKRLMKRLRYDLGEEHNNRRSSNEFLIFENTYQRIVKNKQEIDSFIRNNNNVLRDKLLYQIMMGQEMKEHIIADKMYVLNLEFSGKRFNVLLVEIFLMGMWNHSAYKDIISWRLVVISLAEDVLRLRGLDGVVFDLDEKLVSIFLNVDDNGPEVVEPLVDELRKVAAMYVPVPVRIGAGDTVDYLSELYKSYQTAKRRLSYLPGQQGGNDEFYLNVTLYEKQFANAILSKNYAQLENMIDHIVHDSAVTDRMSWVQVYNTWLQILSTSIKTLENVSWSMYRDYINRAVYTKLSDFSTSAELSEWLKHFYEEMIADLNSYEQEIQTPSNLRIEKVKEIIHSRYMQDLSQESVADEIEMNPAYLSKIFKEYVGTNFNVYLNQYRIEKSKEYLLQVPYLSMNEVVQKVGYNNTQSYTRFFKRFEGQSPHQYRTQKSFTATKLKSDD